MVDKDDLTQTTIIMGHKGIRADNPYYAGVQVGNRILGGGFATRLFNEVRSRQGLAYSVGSSRGTGFRYPGLFMAFTMTKSETSEKATEAVLAEIEKMIDRRGHRRGAGTGQGRDPQLRGLQLRHQARDPRPHGHVRALRLPGGFPAEVPGRRSRP